MRVTVFGASGLLGKALMRERKGNLITGCRQKRSIVEDLPGQPLARFSSRVSALLELSLIRCRRMRN